MEIRGSAISLTELQERPAEPPGNCRPREFPTYAAQRLPLHPPDIPWRFSAPSRPKRNLSALFAAGPLLAFLHILVEELSCDTASKSSGVDGVHRLGERGACLLDTRLRQLLTQCALSASRHGLTPTMPALRSAWSRTDLRITTSAVTSLPPQRQMIAQRSDNLGYPTYCPVNGCRKGDGQVQGYLSSRERRQTPTPRRLW